MAKSTKPPVPVSKKGNEFTSPKMATLASKVLSDPKSTTTEKKLAAALLNQAPDKPKKRKSEN